MGVDRGGADVMGVRGGVVFININRIDKEQLFSSLCTLKCLIVDVVKCGLL